MTASKYFLTKHAFACTAQGYWVILDANNDEYLCITQRGFDSLRHQLYGRSDPTENDLRRKSLSATATLDSLVSKGVLTDRQEDGKPFAASSYDAPSRTLSGRVGPPSSLPKFGVQFVKFMFAAGLTDWRLRFSSLASTLRLIEHRQLRRNVPQKQSDITRVEELLTGFRAFRAFYPRPYLCLFDSLCLLEFFALHNFFPRLVFGVIAEPFAAHCWLQQGNLVINDELETIMRYTPVMIQ